MYELYKGQRLSLCVILSVCSTFETELLSCFISFEVGFWHNLMTYC